MTQGVSIRAPQTDRGRRTRDALLAAAREMFELKGFTATRMSDIARAAGVSHGTTYVYFADKDSALRELVGAIVSEVFDAVRVGDIPVSPRARIERANQRYLEVYARNARMLSVVEQVAVTDPYYREVLDQVRHEFTRRVADGIRRLQQRDLADHSVDPERAAPLLCAMVENLAERGGGDRDDAGTLTQLWARAIGLDDNDDQDEGGT
jgi:AcrR family transcriptional regulator